MGRPPRPLISRERAARAALSVIDSQGLESLSLELVARKLGVKAPSLYYHFHDKAELLAEVARLILVDVDAPELKPGAWEDYVVALCVATRRSILRHPNAAILLLQFFPRHVLLAAYDHGLANYPFSPAENFLIMEGLEKLVFGSALFEAAAKARGVNAMPEFDAARFPALADAVRAMKLNNEELFIEVIRTYVSGFVGRRKGAPKKAVAKKAVTESGPRGRSGRRID